MASAESVTEDYQIFLVVVPVGVDVAFDQKSLTVLYQSNLVFIIMQVVGFGGIQYCMARTALLMKKRLAAVLFVLSFIFILGMGYLGAKFDDSSSMHWIAQVTNICSEGCFLGGVLILHKSGLAEIKQ